MPAEEAFTGEPCTMGESGPCACNDGGQGTRTCMADTASPTGSSFGECADCAPPANAGGAGGVAPVPAPGPAPPPPGTAPAPGPTQPQPPTLTLEECVAQQPRADEACAMCNCMNCGDLVAWCSSFEGGSLCQSMDECLANTPPDSCGIDGTGRQSCWVDESGTLAAGPCADEINAAGGGSDAVYSLSCDGAPSANACAAYDTLVACSAQNCGSLCGPNTHENRAGT